MDYIRECNADDIRGSVPQRRLRFQAVVMLQALAWCFEDVPSSCILAGLLAHACYYSLTSNFPMINLTNPKFICSAVLLVATHSLWFRHFTVTYYAFPEVIAYFLLFVWMVNRRPLARAECASNRCQWCC
jgi:hypothetical protein